MLGLTACQLMNLVQINTNAEVIKVQSSTRMTNETVRKQASEVFKDLGELEGECSVKCKNDPKPVIHPPRRVPFAMKKKVKEELQRMESLGVIKKVDQPTEWVNSMVAVEKKNTGKLRICIDPSELNRSIMREHYPLPTRYYHKNKWFKIF